MTKTRTQVTVALAIAALVLAFIVAVSSHATIGANQASSEVLGLDIFGITKSAMNLPEQQFPTH